MPHTLSAPLGPDPARPRIKLALNSKLQNALKDAIKGSDPRGALDKVVDEYIKDKDRYVPSEDFTALQKKLLRFTDVLDKAAKSGPLTPEIVDEASKQQLGGSPKTVADSAEFTDLLGRLKDTVVASKFAQVRHAP